MAELRIEYMAVTQLAGALKNPKLHDGEGIQASVTRFGMAQGIVLDERTSRIVAGHGRRDALLALKAGGKPPPAWIEAVDGEWFVPVTRGWSSTSDQEAEAFLIGDNALTINGGWNDELLAKMLDEMGKAGAPLAGTGFSDEDVQAMLAELGATAGSTPPAPAPSKSPWVKPGDLFALGRHRILCGDSASAADVARLMDGHRAALFATDPPYGVGYGDETGNADSKFGVIANDENDGPRLQAFLESVFRTWLPSLREDAAWYLWHAQMTQGFFAAAAAAAQVLIHRQIIWVKPSLVLGHGDYHWQHEIAFYGWVQGHRCRWFGDRSQTTIWEIPRENDGIHPTQKPVEIFARPMRFNTLRDEICAEPFSGSGSQIMAAEQENRRCFAMELSPAYVQVAIERWEEHTSQKAVKLTT